MNLNLEYAFSVQLVRFNLQLYVYIYDLHINHALIMLM